LADCKTSRRWLAVRLPTDALVTSIGAAAADVAYFIDDPGDKAVFSVLWIVDVVNFIVVQPQVMRATSGFVLFLSPGLAGHVLKNK
jgi:hypothetical protein